MLKKNLILLRNLNGYSQEQTAGKIGISRQAYAKWESGATVPDIEKCARLAEVYGTTVDSLIRTTDVEDVGMLPPGPVGKNIWGSVTLSERGQIVIPKAARDRFGLKSGDRLIVVSDENGIALLPAELFEENLRKILALSKGPDGASSGKRHGGDRG